MGIISFGVFIVSCALAYCAHLLNLIAFGEIIPMILILTGAWITILGVIKVFSRAEYERGAFSTSGWGILTLSVGALWFLNVRGVQFEILVVVFVILLGTLIIIAGVREWSSRAKKT